MPFKDKQKEREFQKEYHKDYYSKNKEVLKKRQSEFGKAKHLFNMLSENVSFSEVKPCGNTSHVLLPKDWEGEMVITIKLKYLRQVPKERFERKGFG